MIILDTDHSHDVTGVFAIGIDRIFIRQNENRFGAFQLVDTNRSLTVVLVASSGSNYFDPIQIDGVHDRCIEVFHPREMSFEQRLKFEVDRVLSR